MINSSKLLNKPNTFTQLTGRKNTNTLIALVLDKTHSQTAFIKHLNDADEGESAVVSPGDVRRWWR